MSELLNNDIRRLKAEFIYKAKEILVCHDGFIWDSQAEIEYERLIDPLLARLEAAECILSEDYTPHGYLKEEMDRWNSWLHAAGKEKGE